MLQQYEQLNRQHLSQWEPLRDKSYFSTEQTRSRVQQHYDDALKGQSLHLVALQHNQTEITAICHFSNIVRGPFQACYLGYSIDHRYQGQGLMFEMLDCSIHHVFNHINLHRIMANYVENNQRSARLLQRLGFAREGYAKSYLHIAGQWRDHILTAKINPKHLGRV